MSTQRISLNSSLLAGRMRKFDTYRYDKTKSQRQINPQPKQIAEIRTAPSLKQKPVVVPVNPTIHKKPVANVTFKQTQSYSQPKLTRNNVSTIDKNDFKQVPKNNASKALASRKATQELSTSLIALNAVKHSKVHTSSVLANQFEPPKKSGRFSKLSQKKVHKLFYTAGLSVFLLATVASVQTIITNHQAKQQLGVLGEQTQVADENGVKEGTGSEPSEEPIGSQAIANYTVSPELPRYIRIPSLGVFARIKHTGVDKEGAVDAPANIYDASWYKASARPGSSSGASLLLGHVSGWTAPGVFKKINQLKAGMRFEIEKGSGEKLTYEVVRGESIPLAQVDMAKILESEVAGGHDLKLMTCSGKYNRETDHYEERYVVYAKILR